MTYKSIKFNAGDNTVTIQSSTNLPVDQDKKFYVLSSDHGKMPSQEGIKQQIVNILTGSNLTINSNLITQDIARCQLNGKVIEVFSPIDLAITDQFGNEIGLAEDKSIINEIPNATFEIMGEHKFIYLPTDENQAYSINMQGTGTGTYTIKVKDIQNTQETKVESFNNLPATTTLTGTINLGNSTTSTILNVKQNANVDFVQIYPSLPEAVIYFDIVTKDLKFVSNDPDVTITDKDDTITLTDKAGNITEIKLKDKNRKIAMKAEIKSIKYNGKLADISKNKMAFLWLYDKKDNLKMLSQYVSSKKDYNVLAVYGGKNTTFVGKDSSGKILKTEKGLKILKITTENGDLKWSY